jgi:hypothetical protein
MKNLVELARMCARNARITTTREVADELWRMAKEYQVWSPGRLHELSRIAAMAQEVLPTAILNRDGATLIQPSSCVVLARTCFPSLTATSLEDANLGKFPSDVPARPTPQRGGIRPHYAKAFR